MYSPVPMPAPHDPVAAAPRRADIGLTRLRRLIDSPEPAIAFCAVVRFCVPDFADECVVDVVEGGRVSYRVAPRSTGPDPTPSGMEVVTSFASHVDGWPSFAGTMTTRWHTRRPTNGDEAHAEAIVAHAVEAVEYERRQDWLRCARPAGRTVSRPQSLPR